MKFVNELADLVKASVIDEETTAKIRAYYASRQRPSANRLLIVFGILGAILVGLGIILIIAHNWDDLAKSTKTVFAFLPLIVGQGVCLFVLLRRNEIIAWREGSSVFLFFSVAAAISLVSQIYNIPGDLGAFLLTWMILCVPLIYVMRSSVTSLLCLVGISWFVWETSYLSPSGESYEYWALLAACIPHYVLLVRKRPSSNFTTFHNWVIPLSLISVMMMFADRSEEFLFVAYMSLFGLFYLIGHLSDFSTLRLRNNGFRVLGSVGTVVLLIVLSFDELWEDLRRESVTIASAMGSMELILACVLTLVAAALFLNHVADKKLSGIRPVAPVFILFPGIFLLGYVSPASVVLVNLLVLGIAVLTIREGARLDHLGVLNYGLIIIAVLVTCRFFDTDLLFVTRGILFIAVGAGFFVTNYRMLQKRKGHA